MRNAKSSVESCCKSFSNVDQGKLVLSRVRRHKSRNEIGQLNKRHGVVQCNAI
jgi:hypothetical protein